MQHSYLKSLFQLSSRRTSDLLSVTKSSIILAFLWFFGLFPAYLCVYGAESPDLKSFVFSALIYAAVSTAICIIVFLLYFVFIAPYDLWKKLKSDMELDVKNTEQIREMEAHILKNKMDVLEEEIIPKEKLIRAMLSYNRILLFHSRFQERILNAINMKMSIANPPRTGGYDSLSNLSHEAREISGRFLAHMGSVDSKNLRDRIYDVSKVESTPNESELEEGDPFANSRQKQEYRKQVMILRNILEIMSTLEKDAVEKLGMQPIFISHDVANALDLRGNTVN